ncbi:MAG: tandem-95 repeat protein [Candidatus Marinimicrobia bacterium]|nr:tandem-95 repeat protein [Candidatus Neomarinimicrobiota bacterium]
MRVLLTLIFVLLSFLSEGALAQNYSNNGNETITDNYTGLTWMQCSVGQTWDGSTCSGTATTHPWDQANALTADYAGYSDWRLPTLQELQSIVDYTTYDPAIDVTSFPGTLPSGYWSSSQSQDPDTTQYALSVFFKNGNHGNANMLYGRYVRLVRGGHFFGSLMDNGDGTVTDKNTELTWMQCSVGQTWDGSTCSGTATTHQWDQATALATDYAGHSDWRLPTLQELQSIVDYTTWYPAIDTTSFPGTLPSGYWSSSLQASNLSIVWVTSFHSGYDLGHDKLGNLYVRLLRGGQVLNLGPTASAGDDQDIDEQTGVTLSGSGSDSDGSIASYSWSQSAGPTVTLNSSSSAAATFTAPAVLIPTDLTFSLTVTDNEGGDGSDSVIITVNPINTLPTASAGSDQDIDEQTGVTLSGSGSDSDGSIASYSWSQSAGPTVTINSSSSAAATFTAPAALIPTDLIFSLTVTDNEGGDGSGSVTITVTPINTLPTASAGSDQDIDEQTGVTLSGSGSDSDGTIASYSWSQSAGPTVTISSSSSATATFTAPVVLIPTDLTFSLTVTDNEGGSGSDSVTITVNPINTLPTASAGSDQDIDEQTGVTLSGSGSDSDGTIASYSWSQSAGPTVTINSSSNVTASFTAPDVSTATTLIFTLTVTDNEGGSGSDSLIITVNPINTLPTASAGSDQDIDEQTGVTLSGSGSDSDGTIASYSWSQSAGPTVTINSSSNVTASFTAPDVSTATTLTFTLIVTDNEGGSGSDSVTITVNPINTLPTASAGNDQDIDEQTGVTLSGSGSDNDGTIVSYSWSQSAGPTVTLNSSSSAIATFTVPAVLISTDLTFSLTVTDNEGGSGSDSVTITVSTLNRVPVGVETTLTTEEESTISGQVSATDPDGGPITYSLASLPSNGTASVSINGSFTYTPTTNFNGADSFTVRAEDERRSYTNLTVSIGVISLNDPPAISSNQKATAQDGASITLTSSQLRATDPEGDNIHYHLTAEPTNGMLTLNGVPVGKGGQFSQEDINQGRVTYNHDSAGTTTDSFSFQLEDELGDVTPGTHIFSFTIEVVNSAPIAVSDNWNTDEDTSINTTLQGSDEDGDTITYELVSGSSLGKIELLDNTTGTVLFTPDSNASGQSSFLYRLFDGVKYSDTARITVTVNPVNDAPVVEESMLSTFRETAMEGTLVASDLDQDSLTFSLGSYPARGIVQLTESSGAFTYTPLAGLDGPDSFTFQVSDGRLTSNLATVTIEVAGDPSLPPVANALSFSLLEDEKLNDQLIGSDSEDDQLSYKIIEPPLHGWVQVTNAGTGSFRYTPHSNYGSSAQFVGS